MKIKGHIILLVLAIVALFALNLVMGSVKIPVSDVVSILLGDDSTKPSWRFIILESRLPHAITAVLCGGALAVSGLMLQTAFRNPLAGPSIFGINSGAGLGVALVMLLLGGSISAGSVSLAGFMAILAAAFVGAMAVMALIFFTRFVLGVEYGDNIPFICLLAAAGGLTATMMGMFLSVILKTRESAKNIIIVIVTMVGSLFAGMFGVTKMFFDELAPVVNKVSPVGLITDGFYSLYYYDDMTRFYVNVISLVIVSLLFFIFSIRSLRRQRYDSI